MPINPPIPTRYTKSFQEQQKAKTQQPQTVVQTQSVANEKQQVYEYYRNAGYSERIAEDYKDLYFLQKELEQAKASGTNQQKIFELEKNINYRQQKISKETFARDTKSPNIIKPTYYQESFEGGYSTGYQASFPMGGKVTSTSFSPASDKSFIASSIKGPDVFITTKGEVTQAPYTPISGGAIFTQQIKVKETIPKKEKNLFDYAYTDIKNFTKPVSDAIPKNAKKELERQRKAGTRLNSLLNQRVGEIGQGIGSVAYEYSYASGRLRNPFFESEFYKTQGPKNLQSKPFINKPKSEKERAEYQVVFQDVALKSQYLVPFYGELKFGLDVAETKDVSGLATGAVAFGALKLVGKGINTLENLPKQTEFKFVTESAEKDLDKIFGPRKKVLPEESFKIENLQKPFSQVLVGGAITAPIAYSVVSKKNFIESEYNIDYQKNLAYEESVKEARQFGAGKTGFQLAEYATPRITPQFYALGARLTGKKEIPYELLESPQLTKGITNYPKATLDPIKFKKFVEATPKTELGKYFENYPQAFNVSKGKLPKEYFAGEGTSEFAGQYFAPRYPSFTFGIPKGGLVKSTGDYSIFPSFESSGPATVNLAYGKGVRIVEVGKDFGSLSKLDPGFFYIPTRKGLRTKTESEVIQNIGTKFIQKKEQYFTLYKGRLAQERGFPGGVFFPIPEYYVEGLGGAKTSSLSNPKTLSRLAQEQERNLSYSKNYGRSTPIGAFYSNQRKKDSYSSNSRSLRYSYTFPSYGSISGSRGSGSSRSVSSGVSRSFSYGGISSSYKPRNYYGTSLSRSTSEPSISYYRGSPSRKGSGTSYPPYRPPSPPKYPNYPSKQMLDKYDSKRREQGFIPFLFKGGKPIRALSSRPFIKQEALAFGANIVNSITKRSFKLVKAGPATAYGIRGPIGILRPGKRDPSLFVERAKFAINTRGEKRELRQARMFKQSKVIGFNRRIKL